MFDKVKQLGELKKMRDQAMQMQKALAQEKIEVEEQGIRIVMTGDQKIETIEIDDENQFKLVDVLNKAIKKSQEVAARKLQEMSGGLGGLLGK
jgi:hypothetical protein